MSEEELLKQLNVDGLESPDDGVEVDQTPEMKWQGGE